MKKKMSQILLWTILLVILIVDSNIKADLKRLAFADHKYAKLYNYDFISTTIGLIITVILCLRLKFGSFKVLKEVKSLRWSHLLMYVLPMILILYTFTPAGYYITYRFSFLRINEVYVNLSSNPLTAQVLTLLTAYVITRSLSYQEVGKHN